MDKPSRSMLSTLRQAQLYGYLIARDDRRQPPLCGLHDANEMVRSGWLAVRDDGGYELTPEGHRAAEHDLT